MVMSREGVRRSWRTSEEEEANLERTRRWKMGCGSGQSHLILNPLAQPSGIRKSELREMAQWLAALATLAGDPGSWYLHGRSQPSKTPVQGGPSTTSDFRVDRAH